MFPDQRLSTLVVDDDPDVVEFMTHVLQSADCDVCSAVDGDQALSKRKSMTLISCFWT